MGGMETNLTPDQIDRISTLRTEAAQAGDLLNVVYCDVALGDQPADETVNALSERDAERYVASTPESAVAACFAALQAVRS